LWEKSLVRTLDKVVHAGLKMLAGLYLVDVTTSVLPIRKDLPVAMFTISKPVWIAFSLAQIKRWVLLSRVDPHKVGRSLVYNRMGDVALAFACFMVISDLLPDELQQLAKSVIAFTGATSVVLALAMREVVSQFIFGLHLMVFSDKFQVGEEIKVEDLVGIVTSVDFFGACIRQHDESIVLIPNVGTYLLLSSNCVVIELYSFNLQ
jgi:small-conductance mechanosensitive channel